MSALAFFEEVFEKILFPQPGHIVSIACTRLRERIQVFETVVIMRNCHV